MKTDSIGVRRGRTKEYKLEQLPEGFSKSAWNYGTYWSNFINARGGGSISMEMLFNITSGTYCLISSLPELLCRIFHVTKCLGDEIEDDGVNETCSSHWKTRNVRGIVIGKSRTKLLRERFRRSWGDNIKLS